MTRFARAKGSKSSNERLPHEPTPWHVLKEQLETALDKDQTTETKTKTAKELLNEREDLYYAKSLGNTNADWAEFETNKNEKHNVKTGKIEKKPKDQTKKLKKTIEKSIEEKNSTDDSNSQKDKLFKTSDSNFAKNNFEDNHNTLVDSNLKKSKSKKEFIKTKCKPENITEEVNSNVKENVFTEEKESIESNSNDFKNKKRKKKETISSDTPKDLENNQSLQTQTDKSIESKSDNLKNKKQKAEKNISSDIPENLENYNKQLVAENLLKNETETHTNFGDKLSKRQKRNKKKQNKKTEIENEKMSNATFNAEGNDWNNSVSFNKRRRFDDDEEKNFNNNTSNNYKERIFNNDLSMKNFNRFGNNVPKKYQKKVAKVRDDEDHKRRKPDAGSIKVTINGMNVEIVKYDGFPIKKEDAQRLIELRKEMVLKGIPKNEIDAAMKLERRKCEKALARIRRQVCFHCRKAGHNLSDCPELGKEEAGTGICFKCGSTEHTHFECKVTKSDDYRYAKCFICREQGHIAKQCPDNPKGLYPDGGSCKICGDVTHLKKDCPDLVKEKEETAITLDTIKDENLESLGGETTKHKSDIKPTKKIVKF